MQSFKHHLKVCTLHEEKKEKRKIWYLLYEPKALSLVPCRTRTTSCPARVAFYVVWWWGQGSQWVNHPWMLARFFRQWIASERRVIRKKHCKGCAVSWASGLEYRSQELVANLKECGFESRSWHLCAWAIKFNCFSSPRGKWVPVRAVMVLVFDSA